MIHGICFTYHCESSFIDSALASVISSVGSCGIAYIIAGKEYGENGQTPHLQGYLQANHDHYSRFKRQFDNDTIHFEKQKGDSREAVDYCKKDGDWLENGLYRHIQSPKKRQGTRSDLEKVKEAIDRGDGYEEIMDEHFGVAAKYSKFIQERIMSRDNTRTLKEIEARLLTERPRQWQRAVIDRIQQDPDPRKIHWYWDPTGSVGKSWLANYLGAIHKAIILDGGKRTDMAYIVSKSPQAPIVVFDCARTTESFMDSAYALAEGLKNGRITSPKYDSKTVFFPPKHILFFANFEPDMSKWSGDRYDIVRVGGPMDLALC